MIVHGRAHNEGAHNHLGDLHDSDDPGREPLRNALDSLHKIVEVHHCMHRVIHRYEIQS